MRPSLLGLHPHSAEVLSVQLSHLALIPYLKVLFFFFFFFCVLLVTFQTKLIPRCSSLEFIFLIETNGNLNHKTFKSFTAHCFQSRVPYIVSYNLSRRTEYCCVIPRDNTTTGDKTQTNQKKNKNTPKKTNS